MLDCAYSSSLLYVHHVRTLLFQFELNKLTWCFFLLGQIVIWFIIPAIKSSHSDHTTNTLVLIVLLQYVPRLYLIFPLSSQLIKATGVVTKTAWAGAAYNLVLYMLASHVCSCLYITCSATSCYQGSYELCCNDSDHSCRSWVRHGICCRSSDTQHAWNPNATRNLPPWSASFVTWIVILLMQASASYGATLRASSAIATRMGISRSNMAYSRKLSQRMLCPQYFSRSICTVCGGDCKT